MSLSEPVVQTRDEQSYVAIRASVTMETIGSAADMLIPEIVQWATSRGVGGGAPIMRYLVIDMAAELVIEVGVPTDGSVVGDDRVTAGSLPGGSYLTATHTGPWDRLESATGEFLARAAEMGLTFDVSANSQSEHWVSRVEHYLTDPGEQPDAEKWECQLAFKLRA